MTSSRQFPPRLPQEDRAVESRLGFAGSRAGRVRNAAPILQVDRVTAQVSAATQAVETSFWYEDHFTVSSTTPGTFALTYLPRDNSEDITVNGVTLLPGTEWTRTGSTLTIAAGVWLGLNPSYPWDLVVQYEVASLAAVPLTQTFASAAMELGPLAYWKLDEVSGTTAADSSGNGFAGTYTASPTLGQPKIASGLGASTLFTAASSQYVAIPAFATPLLKTHYTVVGWAIANSISSAFNNPIIAGAYFPGGEIPFAPGIAAIGHFWYSGVWWNSVHADLISSTVAATGTAYFVAVTYDGTHLTLYLNGSQIATSTPSVTQQQIVGGVNIGSFDAGDSGFWDGRISDVVVWASALTATEISDLYTAGTS